jgi:hypothetical protein
MSISLNSIGNPILVTGSHRSGTTWVGKMIALSPQTYYLGEVFHPEDDTFRLGENLLAHWYQYITRETGEMFVDPIHNILSLNFVWPARKGFRRIVPSRLVLLRRLRSLFGLPRPIIKDPLAAMASEWLAETFQMKVICLIRHPAAFVASLIRMNWRFNFRNFLEQPELIDDLLYPFVKEISAMREDIVDQGALLWLCVYHVLSRYLSRHRDWTYWRLEDISMDPRNAFRQIYNDLGLPYRSCIERRIMKFSDASNPVIAPSDNPHSIRRNSRDIKDIWRKSLDVGQIMRIRNIVEPVAHQYYSDEEWAV